VVSPNIRRMTKKRLGEILLAEGILTNLQLEQALAVQKTSSRMLGEILVEMKVVSEKDIAESLCTQFSCPYVSTEQYFVSGDVASLIPIEVMRKYLLVPVDKFSNILTIAVAGALSEEVVQEIQRLTGCDIHVFVSTMSDIRSTIERLEKQSKRSSEEDKSVSEVTPKRRRAPVKGEEEIPEGETEEAGSEE